jgi:predicted kinase
VTRLIVLNGPPGCGQSTLARRYVQDHPPALNLDIDRVRDMLGGWREDPHGAGLLARAISLAAAEVHLLAGHDVVIPQYLGRPTFLDQVQRLAHQVGATVYEVVLMDTKPNALRRFTARADRTADPAGRAAAEDLDRQGGTAELAAMYDRLLEIIATRRHTIVIDNPEGQADTAYTELARAVTGR